MKCSGAIENTICYQVTLVVMASHDQKLYWSSFQLSWPEKCIGAIDGAINIMLWWHWHQGIPSLRKSCWTTIQVCWPKKCIVPLMMLLALCHAGANGLTWPKRHVTYHFSCLFIRNTMIPLMMLLASYETYTYPIGIMWHKYQWHHLLPMPVAIVSHDQKKPHYI